MPERETREVELRLLGRREPGSNRRIVRIPKGITPDLIKYRGRTFVRRTDEKYSEASVWPIIEDLDANSR